MQTQIPDFLLEMSKQLHEQDNRITAEPIFQVRCKRWRPTGEGYSDHTQLYCSELCDLVANADTDLSQKAESIYDYIEDEDGSFVSDWINNYWEENLTDRYWSNPPKNDSELKDQRKDVFVDCFDCFNDDLPDAMELIYVEQYEEVIKTCLTEADANAFIKRKQHDYPKLYIYVESMIYCPQMIELRNWIMSLTEPKA